MRKVGVKSERALPMNLGDAKVESSTVTNKRSKSPFSVLDDLWGGEKRIRDEETSENIYKDRLEDISCTATAGMIDKHE